MQTNRVTGAQPRLSLVIVSALVIAVAFSATGCAALMTDKQRAAVADVRAHKASRGAYVAVNTQEARSSRVVGRMATCEEASVFGAPSASCREWAAQNDRERKAERGRLVAQRRAMPRAEPRECDAYCQVNQQLNSPQAVEGRARTARLRRFKAGLSREGRRAFETSAQIIAERQMIEDGGS